MSIPEPYVQGHMHGGPHDGETIPMPWARIQVPVMGRIGEVAVVSLYTLAAPWRGQADAEYQYQDPSTR